MQMQKFRSAINISGVPYLKLIIEVRYLMMYRIQILNLSIEFNIESKYQS